MTDAEKIAKIKELVDKYEEPEEREDDWCVYDYSGGNVDDAYQLGESDAEKYFAASIRQIIASFLIVIALASPAFAQVKPAHRIVVRDSVYNVSSIKSTYREKINKLNALRAKRGEEHVIFELTDSSYPLDVKKADVPAKELKQIPDPRPFDVKHPVVSYGVKTGVNVLCTLVGLFAGK